MTTEVARNSVVECFSFKWTIHNFALLMGQIFNDRYRPIVSEAMTIGNTTWQMKMVFDDSVNMHTYYNDKSYMCLCLILLSQPERWVTYELTLQNDTTSWSSSGKKTKKSSHAELIYPDQEFGKLNLGQFSEFEIKKFNGKLSVHCELKTLICEENNEPVVSVPKCDLSLRMKHKFEEEEYCDFTIVAGVTEFKVHRAILSARSAVFETMFRCGLKESIERNVHICDIEPHVVKEMLIYIYTGEAPNISQDDMAIQLLYATEKYQLECLKTMCEKVLIGKVQIENAAEMFVSADRYKLPNLKQQSLQVMSSNWQGFIRTKGWQEITKNLSFVVELMETISNLEIVPVSNGVRM